MTANDREPSTVVIGVLSHFFPPDLGGISRLHSYTIGNYPALGVQPVVLTKPAEHSLGPPVVPNGRVYRFAEYGTVFDAVRTGREASDRPVSSPKFWDLTSVESVATKAVEVFRSHGVSLVNSHVYSDLRIGMYVARELGIPHVHVGHAAYRTDAFVRTEASRLGTQDPIARQEEIKATLRSDEVDLYIVHTEYLRRKYIGLGVAPERIVTVRPAVDLRAFRRDRSGAARVRARLGITDEPLVMCPTLRKHGFEFLLRAFARLVGRIGSARLWCCDIDVLPREYARLARRLGVYRQISCGLVPDDAMAGLYSASNVVVLCSTEEGIGLPILEARACGVPVVTHRFGPFLELIRDREDGLLVDIGDTAGMADAMEEVVVDSSLRDQLIAGGLGSVRRFSHEEMASRYVELFRAILQPAAESAAVSSC